MSIMTSLAPLLAGIHYWAFFFSRTIQGISGGFFFSAGCALASRWFPANEKSTLAAIYGSGSGVRHLFDWLRPGNLTMSSKRKKNDSSDEESDEVDWQKRKRIETC
ncbi:unnamed protein product, partial [Mesorhabditis belari]|uniref:Major facilitator superfamily (MFS) profile domain-containing protein n=1 Tax=Mesorhabditis belari TaxID=2138241 RepID=A0AAF3FTU3_9BILA